jgi:hypothetical protein
MCNCSKTLVIGYQQTTFAQALTGGGCRPAVNATTALKNIQPITSVLLAEFFCWNWMEKIPGQQIHWQRSWAYHFMLSLGLTLLTH